MPPPIVFYMERNLEKEMFPPKDDEEIEEEKRKVRSEPSEKVAET